MTDPYAEQRKQARLNHAEHRYERAKRRHVEIVEIKDCEEINECMLKMQEAHCAYILAARQPNERDAKREWMRLRQKYDSLRLKVHELTQPAGIRAECEAEQELLEAKQELTRIREQDAHTQRSLSESQP